MSTPSARPTLGRVHSGQGIVTTLATVAAALALVVLAVPSLAGAQAGSDGGATSSEAHSWSVGPDPTGAAGERANFSFVVAPGDTVTDTVRVTNLGASPLVLDLYAADAVLTEGAGIDMAAADDTPSEVGAWVDLAEGTLVVPVGGGVDVPFEVSVPAGTAPGDRTGGIVTSLSVTETDAGGREVTTEMRLVSRVQIRVTGQVDASLEVSDLGLTYHRSGNPLSSGSATVTYTVTNAGNVRAGAEQVVRLRGLFGFTGREAALDDIPELLPGASLDVEVEIDGVWPAVRTTTSVELRPKVGSVGGGAGPLLDRVTTSSSTTTFPWPQVIIVVVVLAAWWWKRRSDRRRIDQAVSSAVAAATGASRAGSGPTPTT